MDEGQFGTVLVNLFLNALDAMPGGGRLEVELDGRGDGGRGSPSATPGPASPPEMAGRLFTPFATTKATGTGLGLSLSSRILKEHGGDVTAANRPEGGASSSSPCRRHPWRNAMAILLVIDDEESVRYSFRRVFGAEGVERAGRRRRPRTAWLRFGEHNPDVILLDLQLPDRTGLDVFREIHARDPRRPVVFITAHAQLREMLLVLGE